MGVVSPWQGSVVWRVDSYDLHLEVGVGLIPLTWMSIAPWRLIDPPIAVSMSVVRLVPMDSVGTQGHRWCIADSGSVACRSLGQFI